MTQRSMFFDSSSGDRIYTSDSWAQIFGRIFSDGVVAGYASACAVAASGPAAMSVVVPLGSLWVQGRFLDVYTSNETLTVLTSDPTNPRIDRVVARLDYTGRTLALAVLKGTAAATPVAPALTQNTTTWEMSLAQIRVNAGATSIVTGNITDERTFITNAAAIAFGKVVVGATTITSTIAGDTLNMVAGSNVTLTPNAGTKTVTVAVAGGSGSGLNADTLDGIDSTGFSLSTHLHDSRYLQLAGGTMTGALTVQGQTIVDPNAGSPLSTVLIIRNQNSGGIPEIVLRTDAGGVGDCILQPVGTGGAAQIQLSAPLGLKVPGGGASIVGNSSVTGTFTTSGATTSGGALAVSVGGAAITGNSSVTGTLAVSSGITSNSLPVPTLTGGGTKVTVGTSVSGTPSTGDVWIDTSVVL